MKVRPHPGITNTEVRRGSPCREGGERVADCVPRCPHVSEQAAGYPNVAQLPPRGTGPLSWGTSFRGPAARTIRHLVLGGWREERAPRQDGSNPYASHRAAETGYTKEHSGSCTRTQPWEKGGGAGGRREAPRERGPGPAGAGSGEAGGRHEGPAGPAAATAGAPHPGSAQPLPPNLRWTWSVTFCREPRPLVPGARGVAPESAQTACGWARGVAAPSGQETGRPASGECVAPTRARSQTGQAAPHGTRHRAAATRPAAALPGGSRRGMSCVLSDSRDDTEDRGAGGQC